MFWVVFIEDIFGNKGNLDYVLANNLQLKRFDIGGAPFGKEFHYFVEGIVFVIKGRSYKFDVLF